MPRKTAGRGESQTLAETHGVRCAKSMKSKPKSRKQSGALQPDKRAQVGSMRLFATAPRELCPALSQPRAVLILMREHHLFIRKHMPKDCHARIDDQIMLAESGIETLNELIGDKPKLRRG